MPIKYCPSCGARNEYSVNPPASCDRCNKSMNAGFKQPVVAKKKVVESVDNVEDEDEAEEMVAKPKPRKSTFATALKNAAKKGVASEEEETDDADEIEKELAASKNADSGDEDNDGDYDEEQMLENAETLASSIDMDSIHVDFGNQEDHVRLGDLSNVRDVVTQTVAAKQKNKKTD